MRLTFSQVKGTIARALNMLPTDARVAEYTNRAQERLLYKGKWVGTYGRYRVCVQDSCLTWPREIETIEAAAYCSVPLTIRGEWYEFVEAGPGILAEDGNAGLQLIDRGEAIAFDDVKGTGKKLAVYCDGTEAAGARILLRYYDSNAQKQRTVDGDDVIEGEYVTLPAAAGYAYTAKEVMPGGYYGVVKPVTKYPVRIYEYTVAGGALRPLAYYEPDEETPVYRRSLIPGISCGCADASGPCTTLDVVGKFRHRPVSGDNDFLLISHIEALREMVQSILKKENNLWDEASKYSASAVAMLDEQLDHWRGSGIVQPIQTAGGDVWGGGGVLNVQ